MERLDDLKKKWAAGISTPAGYDAMAIEKVVKRRVSKHTRVAIKYFWASFALQVVVYALLSHVIAKYWGDLYTMVPSILGILIFIPFTKTLMTRFKALASANLVSHEQASIHAYILRQRELLQGFLSFKRRYELLSIPLSCAIGALLTFKLYVPGGAYAHLGGLMTTVAISVVSCYLAIYRENKIHFIEPIAELTKVLDEYSS